MTNKGSSGRVLSICLALALLIGSSLGPLPSVSAQGGIAVSKVSSQLDMRIKLKTRYLAQAGNMSQGQVALPGADIQAAGDLTQLNHEKVFLRFSRQPTPAQLSELSLLGVTAYPDSWIPPAGNHPTGFILADMPVDKLDALAAKNYVVGMDTAEHVLHLQNDQAQAAMGVASVWSGGYTGAGVTVAVLDSGIDTSNADFPALNTSNSKDYSNYPTLDDTITNTVTGHGTHVAGSVLGWGVNSAIFKGVAPGASLVFLKVGKDNGVITDNAITYAMRDAVDVYHAKIINMSIGGWSDYHDGSDATSQAVDYAVSRGATVFISAGNSGDDGWHYSGTVAAGSTTGFVQLNLTGGSGTNTGMAFNLVWYDGLGAHNGLSLKYYNSSQIELTTVTAGARSESSRGTESLYSYYNYYVGAGTRYLKVQNSSSSSQTFHIYYDDSYNATGAAAVTFASADSNYTLGSPAEADSAIAVGAYVTRTDWTNYKGAVYSWGETLNTIASFSSRGPRVDGGAPGKSNIVAPGSSIVSVRDNTVYPWPSYNTGADAYPYSGYIIDNDGLNQNGSGPANYFVMDGTSMASPLAAGVGALLLSKTPSLTPAQVRHALESTATDKGAAGRDDTYGWGLVNALAASNASTTFASYSNSGHTTPCVNFTNLASENTVYMYGTGFLKSHLYRVAYYDGASSKIATADVTSSGTGTLSSQHTFVSGTETAGTWYVVVSEPQFTPSSTYAASWAYTIVSNTFTVQPQAMPGPLAIATASLPNGQVGITYSQTLAASGGTPPYTWSMSAGSLPAGLNLNAATSPTTTSATAPFAGGTANVIRYLAVSRNFASDNTVWAASFANVYRSVDGGSTWTVLPTPGGADGASIFITGLDVAADTSGTGLAVVVGTANHTASAFGNTYMWRSANPAWYALNSGNGEVLAVKFSSNYLSDGTLFVVRSGDNYATAGTIARATVINIIANVPVPNWAGFILDTSAGGAADGFFPTGVPAALGDPALATGDGVPRVSIAIPSGFSMTTMGRMVYVGFANKAAGGAFNGTGDTYRVESRTAPGFTASAVFAMQVAGSNRDSNSVGIIGPASTPTVLAGRATLDAGQLQVFRTSSPYSQPPVWALSASPPGGTTSLVLLVDPAVASTNRVFAGSSGSSDSGSNTFVSYNYGQDFVAFGGALAAGSSNVLAMAASPDGATVFASGANAAPNAGPTAFTIYKSVGGAHFASGAGAITGTPTTTGTSNFTVQVTDSLGGTTTKSLSITIRAAPTITTTSLPSGEMGIAYSQTLTASGGTPPYTWSISAGSPPSGLSLNASTGVISGTPATAFGIFNFTVQVTGSAGGAATKALSITIVAGPTIDTASLPNGEVGVAYSQTLAASGGIPPYTWSISSGALPAGLSLNASTGAVTGTPTTAGTFNFTAQITDSVGGTATRALSIAVDSAGTTVPVITTTSLPNGQAGNTYFQTLAASGGTPPYTWSVSAGSLPSGLSLNASTGAVSGTPAGAGTSSFTVRVTGSTAGSRTKALSITVINVGSGTVPTITTDSLPDGRRGIAYSQVLTAINGLLPYTWSITAGSLPAGLSLNASTGAITGTPAATGVSNFTVKVTTRLSQSATRSLSITIISGPTINTASLSDGEVGIAYSQTLAATSGAPPYTWSISGGALPPGLSLNAATGAITGTPTTPGTTSFTARATDSPGGWSDRALSITIVSGPGIPTTSLPGGDIGFAYSQTLAATGGIPPYTWSVSVGSLPAGLSLNAATGAITGTPTTLGTSSFTARVTDSVGGTATRALSITIVPAPVVTTVSLPNGEAGAVYSQTLAATGGTPPYIWSISAGSLPAGLSLEAATGAITGTPSTPGSFSFTARATDSVGGAATKALSITIIPGPAVNTLSLPNGEVGIAYSQTLAASSGTPPYVWSVSAGSLPAGLSLNAATGAITGTPSAPGIFSFTARATDSLGSAATRALSITIVPMPAIVTASLDAGAVGIAYSQTLAVSGGTAPYAWSISSGTLPPWATLNPGTGAITGTPNAVATTAFTVRVTDSFGATATRALSITIYPGPSITVTSPNGGEVWLRGSRQTITWTSVAVTGNVAILLSVNGGSSWSFVLASSTPNSGSFAWTVNGLPTTRMRIKVASVSNTAVFDISDANFTVR